ncbi:peptidase inhibitor family I36 protein [Kitasatospora sp. NPDC051853]|uniref:peptidase inhibitor family I36 protein n=1 Tax=Kitasatospora sp. NPDC051853 TaxID=3364058 RepID=UPI0037ACBF35
MRLRNLAAAGLLALTTVAGVGVGVGTAHANPSCPDAYACLYSDAGFSGYKRTDFNSRSSWAAVTYDGTSIPLYRGDGVLTNVSSLDNWDKVKPIAVYYNSGWAGPCFTVAVFGQVSDFGGIVLPNGKSANDNMNSHRFGYTCGAVYNF